VTWSVHLFPQGNYRPHTKSNHNTMIQSEHQWSPKTQPPLHIAAGRAAMLQTLNLSSFVVLDHNGVWQKSWTVTLWFTESFSAIWSHSRRRSEINNKKWRIIRNKWKNLMEPTLQVKRKKKSWCFEVIHSVQTILTLKLLPGEWEWVEIHYNRNTFQDWC